MAAHRHRRHSTAFKIEVVQKVLDGEGTMNAVAHAHDLTRSLLRTWVAQFERGELIDEDRHAETARDALARVARLERKIGQLTMELEALKKGAQVQARLRSGRALIVSGPRVGPSRGDAGR